MRIEQADTQEARHAEWARGNPLRSSQGFDDPSRFQQEPRVNLSSAGHTRSQERSRPRDRVMAPGKACAPSAWLP